MPSKKTLLVDFDGVLHKYDGNFTLLLGGPIDGARKACLLLAQHFRLVCFTTRTPREDVEVWLRRWGFPSMPVTDKKEAAFLTIDDRALTFDGEWNDLLLERIRGFSPWWSTQSKAEE